MRESLNKINIVGKLVENGLAIKESVKGTFIAGMLSVEVAPNNIIQVNFIANEKKKDGGVNKVFASLNTVRQEYESVAQVGEENADLVKISGGRIEVNDFYTNDMELITVNRLGGSFVNRLTRAEECKATFQAEVYINDIIEEIVQDDSTGRMIILGYGIGYADKLIPMKLIVPEKLAKDVNRIYNVGDTAVFSGKIKYISTPVEKVTETAFGDPIVNQYTKTSKELIITGGQEPATETAYEDKEIKAAKKVRESMLADLKTAAEEKKKGLGGNNNNTQRSPF